MQWQKSYGGSLDDIGAHLVATSDGGYILNGYSYSNDGDVSGHHGSSSTADVWIIKINSTGVIQWQKSYGGSGNDQLNAMLTVADGFIFTASSNSSDGDVTGNHGGNDYWVVKIDTTGTIQWENSYGGSGDDIPEALQATKDGGYAVTGYVQSNDGEVSGNHGGYDYWVIKLSSSGTLQWQKCFGGSGNDNATSLVQLSDSSYVIAGASNSGNNGDVTGAYGGYDYWIVKISKTGTLIWEKSFGGSSDDFTSAINSTVDGGFIISGHSMSDDGVVTGHHGPARLHWDYWLVKLSSSGVLQWQKSLGGSGDETSFDVQPTSDAGYVVAGISNSTDGDVTGNHGGNDFWIVKLNIDPLLGLKVSIAAKPGTTICAQTKVTVTASAVNADSSIIYQWKKDNIVVGTNSATYTDSLLNNTDSVICVITDAGKTVTSNKIKFIVNPLLIPSVSITATPGTEVCTGIKVALTATDTNGGVAPIYQWKKNGITVGTDSTFYTDSIPQNGDSISVILTSNATCLATKYATNAVKIKVDSPVPVITIATAKDTICSNTTATFTATVNPTFQWKKDGIVVGNNTNVYKDSTLKTGDNVQCFLVSGVSACNGSTSNIINSNQIKFKVNAAPAQPSAISGPVNVKSGQKGIYFNVVAVAGLTYIWTLPAGAVIDSGQGGNKIKVDWGSTSGNVSIIAINGCGGSSPRTLAVNVTSLIGPGTGGSDNMVVAANGLKLYPNPANAGATLQFTSKTAAKYGITILDADNNVIEVKSGTSAPGINTIKINTAKYAKGVYFITISNKENEQRTVEFVKGE